MSTRKAKTTYSAFKVNIYGKVQGVFYRASMHQWCCAHGITGWIKNELDGSVSMHIEGKKELVKECLQIAQQGSPHAIVHKIITHEVEPKQYTIFTVLR